MIQPKQYRALSLSSGLPYKGYYVKDNKGYHYLATGRNDMGMLDIVKIDFKTLKEVEL